MLSEQETEQLIDLLCATAEVLGHEIRPVAAALMAEDLSKYPLPTLSKALARCRSELTGRLTPKDILDRLEDGGVWLSANEAWALALKAADEAQTVVWTSEIAKAWQIALPILDAGDKVGARMAFIPAYERLVKSAREEGKPVQWQISQGWDPHLREVAVQQAVSAGLLPPPKRDPLLALPSPDAEKLDQDAMILPERGEVKDRRAEMAERFRQLGEALRADRQQNEEERARQREEARKAFEARKAEVVAQALELEKQHQEKKDA